MPPDPPADDLGRMPDPELARLRAGGSHEHRPLPADDDRRGHGAADSGERTRREDIQAWVDAAARRAADTASQGLSGVPKIVANLTAVGFICFTFHQIVGHYLDADTKRTEAMMHLIDLNNQTGKRWENEVREVREVGNRRQEQIVAEARETRAEVRSIANDTRETNRAVLRLVDTLIRDQKELKKAVEGLPQGPLAGGRPPHEPHGPPEPAPMPRPKE